MSRADRPFLLFDLGGVLVDNAAGERLEILLEGRHDRVLFKDRWLASPSVRAFERGDLDPEAFAADFVREWQLAMEPDAFTAEFSGWARGFYPGAEEFLRELRRDYRIGCLSNSNALHWQRFRGFQDHFDVALSSHLLRAVKPDRECFSRALAALALPSETIVYFDDALPNVRAAAELGLRAVHVRDFADLEARLAGGAAGGQGGAS